MRGYALYFARLLFALHIAMASASAASSGLGSSLIERRTLTIFWTCVLSVKFLGEKMNWIKWSGILIILIGVSFIGFGSG